MEKKILCGYFQQLFVEHLGAYFDVAAMTGKSVSGGVGYWLSLHRGNVPVLTSNRDGEGERCTWVCARLWKQ